MTDITLKTIASGYNLNKINDNFVTLEDNINNTSIQSTGGNNVMSQDFDMNSKRMINLPAPVSGSEPIRLSDAEVLASQTTGGSTISETPPIINTPGDRWTRCSDMKAFLWYVDVDGGQWIEDRPSYGIDTIQNLTLPYEFATVAAYKAFTVSFPVGKVINLLDRGASFTIIAGTGTANTANIIASDVVSQSADLIIKDYINLVEFGSIAGTLSTVAIQTAFALQQTIKLPIKIPDAFPLRHMVDGQLEYWCAGISGDGRFTSMLESSYVGTILKRKESSDEGEIADFTLYGSGEGVVGTIGMGHGDNINTGFFGTQFTNVSFRDMEMGVELNKSLFVTFKNTNMRRVKRGVFAIGGVGAWNQDWFNNQITFINTVFHSCSEYAIDFVGTGLAFTGTNTMQACGDGLRIDRDTENRSNVNTAEVLYFEFNSGYDIKLKDTKFSMGPVMHQGGAGTVAKPNTLGNVYADNSLVYATGRPAYLDNQVTRITLINSSTYTSMSTEIVSGKNSADTTSKFVYLPDRAADKRVIQTLTDVDTTPATLAAPIGTSTRYTNHVIAWIIEAPNGEYASFTTYGKLRSGSYKTNVGGNVTTETESEFTLNLGVGTYKIKTSPSNGTMTIESSVTETGDTILTTRVLDSRAEPLY